MQCCIALLGGWGALRASQRDATQPPPRASQRDARALRALLCNATQAKRCKRGVALSWAYEAWRACPCTANQVCRTRSGSALASHASIRNACDARAEPVKLQELRGTTQQISVATCEQLGWQRSATMPVDTRDWEERSILEVCCLRSTEKWRSSDCILLQVSNNLTRVLEFGYSRYC